MADEEVNVNGSQIGILNKNFCTNSRGKAMKKPTSRYCTLTLKKFLCIKAMASIGKDTNEKN